MTNEAPHPDTVLRKRMAIGCAIFVVLLLVSPSFRAFCHDPITATTNWVRSAPKVIETRSRVIEGFLDDDVEIRCTLGNYGKDGDFTVISRLESGTNRWEKQQSVRIPRGGTVNVVFQFPEYVRGGGNYAVGFSEKWFENRQRFKPIGQ